MYAVCGKSLNHPNEIEVIWTKSCTTYETALPQRDRGHLAKIMYHVRNCTKFDKTDVVTKWLSKGKRSMSMFLRVLSSGRIA